MTRIRDIDFLDDEALRSCLVRWSYAICGVGLALGIALGLAGLFDFSAEAQRLAGPDGWGVALWGVLLVVVTLAVLPVHELVHAALFRLFGGPGTRVRFGCQQGMLYAGCPGLVLARPQFCAVLLGPAVILSIVLLVVPATAGLPLLGYACFVLHLAGCTGDLLAVGCIRSERGCTHCEDTATGVRILGE